MVDVTTARTNPVPRALALVGSGLAIILGGAVLGVAAFTKTISPPGVWLAIAVTACIAGVALMVYGEKPLLVRESPPFEGANSAGDSVVNAPPPILRPRTWATIAGWVMVALTVPAVFLLATGRGDALAVINVAMGLILGATFLAIGRRGRK